MFVVDSAVLLHCLKYLHRLAYIHRHYRWMWLLKWLVHLVPEYLVVLNQQMLNGLRKMLMQLSEWDCNKWSDKMIANAMTMKSTTINDCNQFTLMHHLLDQKCSMWVSHSWLNCCFYPLYRPYPIYHFCRSYRSFHSFHLFRLSPYVLFSVLSSLAVELLIYNHDSTIYPVGPVKQIKFTASVFM